MGTASPRLIEAILNGTALVEEDNKYYARTMRNSLKKMRSTTEKTEAEKMLPELNAMLDKLAKKNVIHKNKASNLKSSITKHAQSLK